MHIHASMASLGFSFPKLTCLPTYEFARSTTVEQQFCVLAGISAVTEY